MATEYERLNSEFDKATKEIETIQARQKALEAERAAFLEDVKKKHNVETIDELRLLLDTKQKQSTLSSGSSKFLDEDDDLVQQTSVNTETNSVDETQLQKIIDDYDKMIIEHVNELRGLANAKDEAITKRDDALSLLQQLVDKQQSPDTTNKDRIEVRSPLPITVKIIDYETKLNEACKCLGEEFKVEKDQDQVFLRNKPSNHPTGYQITNQKIVSIDTQPLDATACEKMLLAGSKLYTSPLIVYAPTNDEKQHMETAAKKLGLECKITTSREEHQQLLDQVIQKAKTPPPTLNIEPVADTTKKAEVPDKLAPNTSLPLATQVEELDTSTSHTNTGMRR